MTVLDDFRQKYPQYKDVPDAKLALAIRKKYYADMPAQDFYRKAGLEHLVGLTDKESVTDSMSGLDKFRAGMGKAFVDTARGLHQLGNAALDPFGVDHALNPAVAAQDEQLKREQSDANERDAPLMGTGAGLAGNITGQAAQALLGGTALKGLGLAGSVIPTTYRGAALAGAVQGATQPLEQGQGSGSRLGNAVLGAGGGVVGQAIPSAVGAGARTLRSLIDPLTDSGQARIIANTISKFGHGGNMSPVASAVPGVQPTLAEATGNAGLGQLQRAVTDAGQGDGTLNAFVQRGLDNNAARVAAVRSVAGTPEDLAGAIDARSQAAADLYSKATGQAPVAEVPQAVQELAKRPAMQEAVQVAKRLAANEGVDIGDPLQSVKGLHYVKLALDDMMTPNAASAMGRNQQAALQGTKQALLSEMEKISPEYAQAKDVFQQMSGPVNAMQTGQAFLDKAGGNVTDKLGNPALTANRFAGNLKNLDQIAQKATGFKGAKAEKVFTPEQLATLQAVNDDLGRKAAAESVGKSAGSNTVQNLASQSLLGELTKATGIKGLESNGLIARLVRPLDSAYKLLGAPDEIRGKLAQLMLNPQSKESLAILARLPAKQRGVIERTIAPYTGFVGQEAGVSVRK